MDKKNIQDLEVSLAEEEIIVDKHLETIDCLTKKLAQHKKKSSARKKALKEIQKSFELKNNRYDKLLEENLMLSSQVQGLKQKVSNLEATLAQKTGPKIENTQLSINKNEAIKNNWDLIQKIIKPFK